MPARSRRERRSGASGPRSTTGCCRSKRNSAPRLPILAAGSRSRRRPPPVTADQADLERPPRAAPASSEAIIGNSHELLDHGLTELRQVVLEVADARLRAAHPGRAVERLVRYDGRLLQAAGRSFDLAAARSIVVLGAGKASVAIAAAVERMLGDAITQGLIVTRHASSHALRRIEIVTADHP